VAQEIAGENWQGMASFLSLPPADAPVSHGVLAQIGALGMELIAVE
jgi:hypothetical protein